MVSFDVVSLFTKVPVEESLTLLSQHFDKEIMSLYKHVLTSIYFCVDGQFYEQTDRVAMGSPLSPVIANFYKEDFETKAIEKATHKPACWYRYMDDTFVIWPHGQEKLMDFLNQLNGIHNKIQFTMEIEEAGHLPFLDIDIYRKMDCSLGTQSLSETHPHKPLPTPKIPSPSSQQTLSALVPGTQSKNSMRSGIPCTGINIPHQCLQTKWLQPSADTTSHKTGHTDQQD